MKPFLSLTVFLTFAAAPVFATPATPEGASHLTEVFRRYLGATEGVVSVTSGDKTYTATIDAAPLLATVPADNATVSVSPVVLTLTDQGDGTWAVSMDQALAFDVDGGGHATINRHRVTENAGTV